LVSHSSVEAEDEVPGLSKAFAPGVFSRDDPRIEPCSGYNYAEIAERFPTMGATCAPGKAWERGKR